jgi:uncharacterized protein (TIGR03546 family)
VIETLAKLFKVLNSETEPGQISLGLCLAMVAGFTPVLSLHNLVVLLFVLVLRVNLSAFIASWVVFSALAYALDPLFHMLGQAILTAAALTDVWTMLYNTVWFRLDRLYNTVVMGSLVFSLVLFIPCLMLFNLLIRRYREHILAWVRKTRVAQAIKATKIFTMYQSLSNLKGGVA